MQDNATDAIESTDFEPRTRRALAEVMSVVDLDGTPLSGDETLVRVVTTDGGDYRVDVREGRCTCPDHKHRESRCKHIRRARLALGVESVDTATLAACDVHSRFAEHAPGPVVATSDGGHVNGPSND